MRMKRKLQLIMQESSIQVHGAKVVAKARLIFCLLMLKTASYRRFRQVPYALKWQLAHTSPKHHLTSRGNPSPKNQNRPMPLRDSYRSPDPFTYHTNSSEEKKKSACKQLSLTQSPLHSLWRTLKGPQPKSSPNAAMAFLSHQLYR